MVFDIFSVFSFRKHKNRNGERNQYDWLFNQTNKISLPKRFCILGDQNGTFVESWHSNIFTNNYQNIPKHVEILGTPKYWVVLTPIRYIHSPVFDIFHYVPATLLKYFWNFAEVFIKCLLFLADQNNISKAIIYPCFHRDIGFTSSLL